MTELNDIRREILEELAAAIPPVIADDEVTVAMFQEQYDISYDMAKKILDGEVKAKRMTCRQVRFGQGLAIGYHKVK